MGEAEATADKAQFKGVVASEWTKLWTVPSTYWTLFASAVAVVGFGVLISIAHRTSSPGNGHLHAQQIFDPTRVSLAGIFLAPLILGVLGILVVTSEYSTGTITSTLSAVPRRPQVLTAKILVFGVVAMVVGEVLCYLAFGIGQAILAGGGVSASLGQPGVDRAVFAAGLVLAVVPLLGLGIGSIVRHTAGAIAALVGLVWILTFLSDALPVSWQNVVDKFLPLNIIINLTSVGPSQLGNTPMFSPWVGFAYLCGYAIFAMGLGIWFIDRRDA